MKTDAIRSIYRKRRNYARHAALYVFYRVGLLLFLSAPNYWRETIRMTLPNTGDLILGGFIWAAFFVAHSLTYWAHEREYRALLRTGEQVGEKAKRAQVRLTEDGELVETDVTIPEEDVYKRRL